MKELNLQLENEDNVQVTLYQEVEDGTLTVLDLNLNLKVEDGPDGPIEKLDKVIKTLLTTYTEVYLVQLVQKIASGTFRTWYISFDQTTRTFELDNTEINEFEWLK